MNRISALLILSGLLALPASGATDSLCWNRDTERMDFYTNPPTRGDNNFFSFTVSGTANVTMIYPGTASMKQLPLSLYELRDPAVQGSQTLVAPLGQGCQNAFLNNLDYFMPTTVDPPAASAAYSGSYDPTKRYPEPETTYSGGGGLNDNFEASSYTCSSSSCPTDSTGGKAWRYVLWPANDNGTQDGSNGSIDDACTAATTGGGYLPTDTQDCQLCLKTKGYWINYKLAQTNTSSSAMVAKGNWLNYFPPKWAILRLAYKRLVNGPLLNSMREGIGTQNADKGWYRTQKMLPQSCNGNGRPNQRISSVDGVTYTNTANPLAEMLFNVAWTVSSRTRRASRAPAAMPTRRAAFARDATPDSRCSSPTAAATTASRPATSPTALASCRTTATTSRRLPPAQGRTPPVSPGSAWALRRTATISSTRTCRTAPPR